MAKSSLWEGKEFNLATVAALNSGTQSVADVPIEVRGVVINTVLSAHELVIKDGTTAKDRIPASATAGNTYPFGGTKYTNMVIVPNASATGKIKVIYRIASQT